LIFFDDNYDEDELDGVLKPLWSFESWNNQPLVYSSAIIHTDNELLPKIVRKAAGEGDAMFKRSDAHVHVLFR
jgi:hypothetical protein